MTSNLFSKYGVLKDQFFDLFRVCNYCDRIVCNETSRISGHTCVIDVED